MYKYNFVYKTTNLINNHYYYGVHSTNKLDDNYLGSGKRLNYAIKKYGKHNFVKEIIKYFNTRQEAFEYEELIVNETLIYDNNCYNIVRGGAGVPEHIIEQIVITNKQKKFQQGTNNSQYNTHWINNGIENKKIKHEQLSDYLNNGWLPGKIKTEKYCNMYLGNDKITINIKDKEKYIKLGYNNRKPCLVNVNHCYVNNGIESLLIPKNELTTYLNNGYNKGRIMNKTWMYIKQNSTYISKMVNNNDVDTYKKNGWHIGRKFNKKYNK